MRLRSLRRRHLLADGVPAAALLPELRRLQHRHEHLLAADGVHLLADDLLDLLHDAPAGRQEHVDAGGELAHEARADHELVAHGLRAGGILFDGGQKQLADAHGHPVHDTAGSRDDITHAGRPRSLSPRVSVHILSRGGSQPWLRRDMCRGLPVVPVRDIVLGGDFRSRGRSTSATPAQPALHTRRIGVAGRESWVLAIGDAPEAERLVGVLSADHPRERIHLVGVVPLAELHRLSQAIDHECPDTVILLESDCSSDALDQILAAARESAVRLQVLGEHLGDDAVAMLPSAAQTLFAVPARRPRGYLVKRVFDIAAACALLVLAGPFLAVVALLTRLGSPGPVFYVSWRAGVGEKPFPCYKFRTMCVGADVQQEELESRNEADGCLFKIKDDPRVTRVGRFLRRTSLDELPQLVNVIKGEMSLVGPRPLPLRDVELMDERHKVRHAVLPGMTGLWQVSGRSGLRAVDMMELDMEYIRSWSLLADARILWRTCATVLSRKGAY